MFGAGFFGVCLHLRASEEKRENYDACIMRRKRARMHSKKGSENKVSVFSSACTGEDAGS